MKLLYWSGNEINKAPLYARFCDEVPFSLVQAVESLGFSGYPSIIIIIIFEIGERVLEPVPIFYFFG